MPKICVALFLLCASLKLVLLQGVGSGSQGNLRVCVVEGRGSYKRGNKFCPILDREKSGVECVLGTDRLDCLRRISKGTVDFGVFNPEDLVAAQWANIDVLITNELRLRPRKFEHSIVAVVRRTILPDTQSSVHSILANTTLCHQGHGGDDTRGLSDTLAEYLESLVTEKSCEPGLSLTENRIKSMANFFGRACKAGPWVPDKIRDAELKAKYASLCSSCGSQQCSTADPYWGYSGAFMCLTEGLGEVSWALLDDVQGYFGLVAGSTEYAQPDHYAYLCHDGTWQSMRDNPEPCVWVNIPWPVVVAKRKAAAAVSSLASSLTNASVTVDNHWHGALAAILETHQALSEPLSPQKAPLDYLSEARGFREAYSQSGCNPPRHVTLCTASIIEKNKCDWLSEAGAVYGVIPPLQCNYRTTKEDCFDAVEKGESDTAVADSDWLIRAQRQYKIKPILHEVTPIVGQMKTVVAYVKKDSMMRKIADLRGKRAAFPHFDGFAWHSVSYYLSKDNCNKILSEYFSEVCAPGIETAMNVSSEVVQELTRSCYKEGDKVLGGEIQALRSLVEGNSDVAFLSLATFKQYTNNLIHEPWAKELEKIVPICAEENDKYCFLSWSNLGHIYAPKNISAMKKQEVVNVFTKLDQLFGKNYPFHSAMFSMYGPFNHISDVLFHNSTKTLGTDAILKLHPYDKIPLSFERSISTDSCQFKDFSTDYGTKLKCSLVLFFLLTLVHFIIN